MHRNLGSIRGQYRKAYVARSSEYFKSGRNFVIRKTSYLSAKLDNRYTKY